MKRKIVSLLLILVLLASTVSAATKTQTNTADAMNDLGLFLGTGRGYELDNQLTRAQGVTMLVRMIGKEAEAKNETFGDPFTDVDPWAKGYVGYAWKNKITNGVGATKFGPNMIMTDYMFLTLTLRALGYDDSAAVGDFVWNDPYALAEEVGLIKSTKADSYFTRGEAVEIFWNALNAKLKNSDTTLAETLIEQGVFTAKEFADAAKIQKNGRKENAGVPQHSSGSSSGGSSSGGSSSGGSSSGGSSSSGSSSGGSSSGGSSSGGSTAEPDGITYEDYMEMTAAEQQAYYESFDDPMEFFAWLNAAKAEYEANKNDIEIGSGGSVDLGDIIG